MKYYQTIIMENKEIDGTLYHCLNEENYKKISEEREEQLKEIERLNNEIGMKDFDIEAIKREVKNRDMYINELEKAYCKELERLNKELKSLQDSYDIEEEQANYHIDLTDDLIEEVDRLNNIIKGLDNTIENLEEVIERKDSIINRTTKYVQSLSSKGRGCDIYEDIKQEILKELKGEDKE